MLKLIKYLKPFWLSVLVVVALLYGQVQAELALPDYMSNIVTNGIQNGGITDTALKAVSADKMEKIFLFVDEEGQQKILSNYALDTYTVKQTIEESDGRITEIRNEIPVYVLKDKISAETRKELSDLFSEPLLIVASLSSPEMLEQMQIQDSDQLFAMMKASPEMRENISDRIQERLSSLSEDQINASARLIVKQEYEALQLDVNAMQFRYIMDAGVKMLGIALLGAIAAIAVGFLSAQIAAGVSRNLRSLVFSKVEQFSNAEFNNFSTASLITRTTNDVQQVQQTLIMMLRIIVYAPLMGVGALIKVFQTNNNMLWVIALILVVVLSILLFSFFFVMPKFKIIQKLVDRINLVMREFLEGMPVIRAFNTEKYEEKRFDKANKDITRVNLFVNRALSSIMPLMFFIMNMVPILILWVGSQYIDQGTLQIGDMMAFMQYAIQILISFVMIAMVSMMIPRASVSAGRILEVIHTKLSIEDPISPKCFASKMQGEVVFEHVSFRYPGAEANVLENISFTAKPGKTTAFIGSTGSGKSTIVNLIPRFFDVTEGWILIDGIDIREVTQHHLREKIGYVPQKGILFSGDIESNLRYAKEAATEEEIQNAIAVSQAEEFIASKPEGIKTKIAQGGTNVSGGQKQRLSIARALVKKPEIYIFDDSFSALDFKTDALLREELNKMIAKTGSTIFIVAQRISTIMNADQIIVLNEGKIAGMGSHDELMKTCTVYQEIALSQLSKEELNHE